MRAYMAFSRCVGPEEGAILVIHNTAKEARKLAYGAIDFFEIEWIDQAVLWIRDEDIFLLANQYKLETGDPHYVRNPVGCKSCGLWGCGLTTHDTTAEIYCSYCGGFPGDELIRLLMLRRADPPAGGDVSDES